MSKVPLVTVICSCFNHEAYISHSLDSVLNQTYKNIELIIVDDNSTDASLLKISKWLGNNPNVNFIKNPVNIGITKSFNNAMQQANGKYYIDLAGDDTLLPNCVEKLIAVFLDKNDDNLAIVYGNAAGIDEKGKFISAFFENERLSKIKDAVSTNFYNHLLACSDYMCSVSAMYRKDIFDAVNGYDEKLSFEDLDFWLRVTHKYKIQFIDAIVVEKRFLENSLGNGFYIKTDYSKKLHMSFYIILEKAYYLNKNKKEHYALLQQIYQQSRWAVRTLNLKYLFLYMVLFFKCSYKCIRT
jgi:glycosyltransferase involved in cell wall biosynthesis